MMTLSELFWRGYLLIVIWYIAALAFFVATVYEQHVTGHVSKETHFAFAVFKCVVFGTFFLQFGTYPLCFACVVASGFLFVPKDPSGSPTILEEPDMCFICSEEYVVATKLECRCNQVGPMQARVSCSMFDQVVFSGENVPNV